MNEKQYRKALDVLDLTQAAAGDLFGVGARTSRRWALGEARVPPTVAMLLDLITKEKLELELQIPASAERPQAERRVFSFQAKQAVHAME